jgi:hypothetical protein
VAFVTVSAFLVAAIYSYSSSVAFAQATTACFQPKGTNTLFCTASNTEEWQQCILNPISGDWVCVKMTDEKKKAAQIVTSVPPKLQDALDIAAQESQNTTKVPKGLLKDGGVLSNDNEDEESPDVSPGDDNEDEGPDVSP